MFQIPTKHPKNNHNETIILFLRLCDCASVRLCNCAIVRVCVCACVLVCVCACVRVCVFACVRVCAGARALVRECVSESNKHVNR